MATGSWFDELDVDTVLVRPDFYVFGAAKGTDSAENLLQALAAHLAFPDAASTGVAVTVQGLDLRRNKH